MRQEVETPPADRPSDADRPPLWRRLEAASLGAQCVRALLLCLALYAVLRPENVGLTPNSLDPFFYTGYAINFDDAIRALGQRWYFVSRWTSYMPNRAMTAVFGPFVGRLMWRLALCIGVLVACWRVGRRWRWSLAQELLVGTLVLTMPIFMRALFTDYVEHAVVGFGALLLCFALKLRQTWWSIAATGVLAAAMVIANPIAVSMVAPALVVTVWFGVSGWRRRAVAAAALAVVMAAVVVAGMLWFRWRYGLPNLYQPTIDFLRAEHGPDVLKSPHLDWMLHFTWLYAPPFVLLVLVAAGKIRRARFDRTELVLLWLTGLQYAFLWIDQVVRGGESLEASYYWSFIYPSFGLLVGVLLARAMRHCSVAVIVGFGVGWLALLLVGIPDSAHLPSGAGFFVIAIVVLIGTVLLARRWLPAAVAVTVVFVLWTQIGAPTYVPRAGDATIFLSPGYDRIVSGAGSASEQLYASAVWLEREMDTVDGDALASFLPTSGEAWNTTAIYMPHVAYRLRWVGSTPDEVVQQTLAARGPADPFVLAVVGDPASVGRAAVALEQETDVGRRVLDVQEHDGRRHRLVVFRREADDLPEVGG